MSLEAGLAFGWSSDSLHWVESFLDGEVVVATVEIPPRYRGVTRGSKEVEVEALSVLACLEAVETAYPGFHELVLDPKGQIRRFFPM